MFETFIANMRPKICVIDSLEDEHYLFKGYGSLAYMLSSWHRSRRLAFFLFIISEDQLETSRDVFDSAHEEMVIEVDSMNSF